MRFFAVFAALIVAACAVPTREFIPVLDSHVDTSAWTLPALSAALQNPNTPAQLVPYLEDALNQMMAAIFAGNPTETVLVQTPVGLLDDIVPAPVAPVAPALDSHVHTSAWTLPALSAALQDPNTPAQLVPYLEDALNQMMAAIFAGHPTETVLVQTPVGLLDDIVPAPVAPVAPALDSHVHTSAWTLPALSAALQDPNTPAQLVPYLEDALNQMMAAIFAGHPTESVLIQTPVGLLDDIVPAPVAPVAPVVTPVAPVAPVVTPVAPVAPAESAASPLVQLIVNVNQAASAPAAVAPVVIPTPVAPVVNPTPVAPVSPIAVNPIAPVSPVIVAPAPVVNPVDVIAVLPIMPNPVDVVAVSPPEVNPIDVIAISAPEVNPVDIANPLPVVPAGAVGVVGPLL